jgi:hypothetical protein
MSWTCPHCGEKIEEPKTGSIQFCLRCGEPSSSDRDKTQVAEETQSPDRLDGILRAIMVVSGLIWLVLFFVPFGKASFGMVMSWDLLADREGMSFLVSWPLMLGLLFLVLGAVEPFPKWLRSGAAVVFGTAFLIILGVEEPGGPLGRDLRFAFMGGSVWLLIFPVVGAGLLLRARAARSVGARVLIGLSLLFGIIAYLTPADGQSTLVGAVLRYLGEDEAVRAISRILILLPMFLLLAASVGFRMPVNGDDAARKWAVKLSRIWVLYLPIFCLVYGFMLGVSEESGYFFLMFLKMAAYLGGTVAILTLSIAWLAGFIPGQLLPLIKRESK